MYIYMYRDNEYLNCVDHNSHVVSVMQTADTAVFLSDDIRRFIHTTVLKTSVSRQQWCPIKDHSETPRRSWQSGFRRLLSLDENHFCI